jgi:uncharacterized DUF497 family protein
VRTSLPIETLGECVGFDWDEANIDKNWDRHQVTTEEAEEIFFHEPIVVSSDPMSSSREKRYRLLGETMVGRRLFVEFTVRRKLIRMISARDMNRREHEAYSRYEKENP